MSKYTYCNCADGLESKHVKPYRLVHAKEGQCTLCEHYVVNSDKEISSKLLLEYVKSTLIERNELYTVAPVSNIKRVWNTKKRRVA